MPPAFWNGSDRSERRGTVDLYREAVQVVVCRTPTGTAAQSERAERAEAFSKVQMERGIKFEEALREWRARSESEIKGISTTTS